MGEIIYSRQNERVKTLVKLRSAHYRKRLGRFLIEGLKENEEALRSKITFEEIIFCRHYFSSPREEGVLKMAEENGIPLQEVTKAVFEKISYRDSPDGLLSVAESWEPELENLKLPENPLLLILEGIEKPGNLGSLLRSADAAGVHGIILCNSQVDLFNPNVIHASRGMLFTLPIALASNEESFAFLKKNQIRAFATTPHTENLYWNAKLKQASAILVGSEKDGLSDFWMHQDSVERIKIPLEGQADSLNAGVAGALSLYEALRQRRL